MTKKYELTDETIEHYGCTLHRIRALQDIPRYGVRDGDLGGWLENEKNLSHYGNALVFDNAKVYGNALVSGNAKCTITPIFISGLLWNITITDTHMHIGCEQHTHAEWRAFSKRDIAKMDGRNAARLWHQHREWLLMLCERHAEKAVKHTEDEE